MMPENAQNQPETQPEPDLGQTNLRHKLCAFLERQNRNSDIISRFRSPSGYCSGISSLWLYTKWLQTQSNPDNKSRDDYAWFKKIVGSIVSWDGKRELSKGEIVEFDRFISHMIYFQLTQFYQSSIPFGELDRSMEDTKLRKPKKEYSICALFTLDQLKKLLSTDNIVQEGKLILIFSHDHAMAIFKQENELYYFDPNDPAGEIKTTSTDDIASAIFFSNIFDPFLPSPLGFRMFTFDEKIGEYPKQSDLLEEIGITSDVPYSYEYGYGRSGLITAARTNDLESAKALLNLKNINPNLQDGKHGRTALMAAIANKNFEFVKLFLENGADPSIYDNSGITPLMFAVSSGDLITVRELLKNGANPNIITANKQSAVTLAINHRHIEIIKELLADPKTDINSIITPNIIKNIPNSIKEKFFQELLKHKSRLNFESLFLIRKLVPGFKTAATSAMSSGISSILTTQKQSRNEKENIEIQPITKNKAAHVANKIPKI